MFLPGLYPGRQLGNRLRLMTTGFEGRFKFERRHSNLRRSSYQMLNRVSREAPIGFKSLWRMAYGKWVMRIKC
jgi:hypothetical protein